MQNNICIKMIRKFWFRTFSWSILNSLWKIWKLSRKTIYDFLKTSPLLNIEERVDISALFSVFRLLRTSIELDGFQLTIHFKNCIEKSFLK